jgi:hypothetical protein
MAIAAFVVFLMIPPWWQAPVSGVTRFLRSNLSRGDTTLIPTLFLGRVYYTPQDSLPWYNTLVWTLFVTPAGFLLLGLTGMVRACRRTRNDPIGLLVVANWLFLLGLRSLPHTPGHDGERLFLPAFGCLALAAGLGAATANRWIKMVGIAALAEGAISIALLMPVPLSYYSPLVGGLPNAVRWGMEPTYYWDAMTDDVIGCLNRSVPSGQKILFRAYPTTWRYLRQTGKLQAAVLPDEPGRWAWYVIQARTGSLEPEDRLLIARSGTSNVLMSKFGVPLIYVFPFTELVRALHDVQRSQEATTP